MWGMDSEKEFAMKDCNDTLTIIEKHSKCVSPYKITNAVIDDANLHCDAGLLDVSILSDDDAGGTLQLEVSEGMFGGGIFMVLVDGSELDDASIVGNIITINFPKDTSMVEIFGGSYLTPDKYAGVCDAVHDPPHSYILSPLKQSKSGTTADEIECKNDFVVIQKHDGFPACVTEPSSHKLSGRGWPTVVTYVGGEKENEN